MKKAEKLESTRQILLLSYRVILTILGNALK